MVFYIKILKPRIRNREREYVSASRGKRIISFSEPIDFSVSSFFFFKVKIKRTKKSSEEKLDDSAKFTTKYCYLRYY